MVVFWTFSLGENVNDNIQRSAFSLWGYNDEPITHPPSQYSKESRLFRHGSASKVVYSRLWGVVPIVHKFYGRLSQLCNNEADAVLEYINVICDVQLTDSPVILNQIFNEFVMTIVWGSDWRSASCFINSWSFSRLAITKFYYPSIHSNLSTVLSQ